MKFFNSDEETRTGRNRLPHWQQEGATYFVTYRLADSIPAELLDRWMGEKAEWLEDHPLPWSEDEEAEYHKRFTLHLDTIMDRGHGACVLREKKCRDVLVDSFGRFDGDRYVLHSWIAMPNHVHVSFTLAEGLGLDLVVGGWKKYTARIINDSLGTKGALWQKDYFDRIIRDWRHFMRVARYVRSNPRKAGLRDGEFTLWESDEVKRMLG